MFTYHKIHFVDGANEILSLRAPISLLTFCATNIKNRIFDWFLLMENTSVVCVLGTKVRKRK